MIGPPGENKTTQMVYLHFKNLLMGPLDTTSKFWTDVHDIILLSRQTLQLTQIKEILFSLQINPKFTKLKGNKEFVRKPQTRKMCLALQ